MYVYQDAAGALVTALLKKDPEGHQVYNICTGHKTTVKQVAEMVKGLWGTDFKGKIAFKDPREGDIKHSVCNPEKARKDLGFEASVKLEDGLKQTFQAFKQAVAESKTNK